MKKIMLLKMYETFNLWSTSPEKTKNSIYLFRLQNEVDWSKSLQLYQVKRSFPRVG